MEYGMIKDSHGGFFLYVPPGGRGMDPFFNTI